jgi:hypothetical protein
MTLINSLDSPLMLYSYAGFPEHAWAIFEHGAWVEDEEDGPQVMPFEVEVPVGSHGEENQCVRILSECGSGSGSVDINHCTVCTTILSQIIYLPHASSLHSSTYKAPYPPAHLPLPCRLPAYSPNSFHEPLPPIHMIITVPMLTPQENQRKPN